MKCAPVNVIGKVKTISVNNQSLVANPLVKNISRMVTLIGSDIKKYKID
jgi:hypothetical protein